MTSDADNRRGVLRVSEPGGGSVYHLSAPTPEALDAATSYYAAQGYVVCPFDSLVSD